MKTRRLIYLTIITSSITALMLGFAFQAQENPGKKARKEAMQNFKHKPGNNWNIRWNDKTGTPFSFLGGKITKYSGSPEQIARSFLNEEKLMLGIDLPSRDMKLTKTNYSEKGGTRLTFSQNYKGVPVLGASYLVAVDNSGAIYYVSGDYFPDIDLDTNPSLTPGSARNVIQTDLAGQTVDNITEPELGISVSETDDGLYDYVLVYEMKVRISDPYDRFAYLIDANNGVIINKNSVIKRINGTGDVYNISPLGGSSTVSKTLHRLVSQTPKKLDGDNVIVENDEGSEASESDGVFEYDPDNTHFDEVMAYYHSDEFEVWLIGLGMGTSKVPKVTVQVHHQTVYAQFDVIESVLTVSLADTGTSGNIAGFRDPAKEAAVIAHEYMHAVSEQYNILEQSWEAVAMDEAYSDFFGMAYNNSFLGGTSSRIGTYIRMFKTPDYLRDLNNSSNYSSFEDSYANRYVNSLMLSGALWDYRTDPGVTDADTEEDVLESLNNLDASPDFIDALEAIIPVVNASPHSANLDDLIDAFSAHGILLSPIVTIDGEELVDYQEPEPEYFASVTYGESPFSYVWSVNYKNEGWDAVGGNSNEMVFDLESYEPEIDDHFLVRVVVTDDNSNSDTDILPVTVFEMPKRSVTQLPRSFALNQNYPNPFNPTTTISYQLPEASTVTLTVFNVAGQEVATLVDGPVNAGYHTVRWDASDMASGIYFYRIQAGNFTDMKRMVVIK